jgi:tRNA(His) guanylyltransferase
MNVMNVSAKAVMATWPGDIVLSIGMSDEYSFVLQPFSKLYGRRASKISSAIVSTFTSAFVFHWAQHFPHSPLTVRSILDSLACPPLSLAPASCRVPVLAPLLM